MRKFATLSIICLLMTTSIFAGCSCAKDFDPNDYSKLSENVTLTAQQQQTYDEIEMYASSCENSDLKTETLYNIKVDIQKSSDEKLDIELSIGKLKIDKLLLKKKLDSDIATKERQASNNKESYRRQRDSITNMYYGSQASYNYDKSALERKINEAYSEYLDECRRIDNSNMGQGYKEAYKQNAQKTMQNKISTYNNQLSQLNTQWQNKQNYDKYNNLYNEVDTNLQRDIQILQSEYAGDCLDIESEISKLIQQR